MAAQIFMLIECPSCFALMRGRAKYRRRCGQELAAAGLAANKPNPTSANVKNVRVARFLCVVGVGLLVWGISVGSVDRSILGGFILILGVVGYAQQREKTSKGGRIFLTRCQRRDSVGFLAEDTQHDETKSV